MFSEKFKKVIAIMLIVSMTFCSQGFSVLANGVEDIVENVVEEGVDETLPNYYYEYKEETTIIQKTIITEAVDDGVVDLGEEEEVESEVDAELVEEPEVDEDESAAEVEDEPEVDEDESETEELETEIAEETEAESETELESSDAESVDDTESSDVETTVETETTETFVETETSETVAETEIATDAEIETETETQETIAEINEVTVSNEDLDKIDDVKNNESNIEATESTVEEVYDDEKEVVVIKKYIYATRSIPEDSKWTVKEILMNDQNASFEKMPENEEIVDKFLAKEVKVLLVNQYGDEKVVSVPAKWDIRYIAKDYGETTGRTEEKSYEADGDGNVVAIDNNTGDTEEISAEEFETIETKSDEETTETETELYVEETAPTFEVEGFDGTENVDAAADENRDNEEANDDEHDAKIDDKEIVYEEEIVEGDEPIKVDDDETEKKDTVLGNANNDMLSEQTAGEIKEADLDLAALTNALSSLLGAPVALPGEVDNNPLTVFLMSTGHDHWICGYQHTTDNASDKPHFEGNGPQHPIVGNQGYTAIKDLDELKSVIVNDKKPDGTNIPAGHIRADYDYLYLDDNIVITEALKIKRNLCICLNGKTLSFAADGQISAEYQSGVQGTDGSSTMVISICNCDINGASTGTIDGQSVDRTKPAFWYGWSKGMYIYGGDTLAPDTKKIKIKNFIFDSSSNNYVAPPVYNEWYVTDFSDPVSNHEDISEAYYGPDDGTGNKMRSAFIGFGVNSAQDAQMTARQAHFCNLDVSDMSGNDGGFAYLSFVSELAIENCKFDNIKAHRGAIIAADFGNRFLNKHRDKVANPTEFSTDNSYLFIRKNEVTNSGYLQTNPFGKNTYGDTTLRDGYDSSLTIDEDVNGLFLLENYNGGTTGFAYRGISENKFTDCSTYYDVTGNKNAHGACIYLTFNTIGDNVTNITKNIFHGNNAGAIYIENVRPYTEDYPGAGIINFDDNKIENNKIIDGATSTQSIVGFKNLKTVQINGSGAHSISDNYFKDNSAPGKAILGFENIETAKAFSVEFDRNIVAEINGKALGGAIYLNNVKQAQIGDNNKDQTISGNAMKFKANKSKYGGTIYANDIANFSINGVEIINSIADYGAAIYAETTNHDSTIELKGSKIGGSTTDKCTANAEGIITFKGSSDRTNIFNTDFNFSNDVSHGNTISYNEAKNGAALVLKNVTGTLKRLKIYNNKVTNTSTSDTGSVITVADGEKEVIFDGVKIYNNIVDSIVPKNSTIFVKDAILSLDKGTYIYNNFNPVRLSHATLSMASYNFDAHSLTDADFVGVTDNPNWGDEIVIALNNNSDYVIGIDDDTTSYVDLKQGIIRSNTSLKGNNRTNNDNVAQYECFHDGMFGFINTTGAAPAAQSHIYFGGNISIEKNERTSVDIAALNTKAANIPLEALSYTGEYADAADYIDPTKRHYQLHIRKLDDSDFTDTEKTILKGNVEDIRLGKNGHIEFTPLCSVEDSGKYKEILLFNNSVGEFDGFDNNHIQGYDGGTGGAIPNALYNNDHFVSGTIDNRVVYYDQVTGKTFIIDSAGLVDFEFEMLYPTSYAESPDLYVDKIPSQKVMQGTKIMRPIKDISLSDDSSQYIYTKGNGSYAGKMRAFDVIGDRNPILSGDIRATNSHMRFLSWDYTSTVSITSAETSSSPRLYVVYARVGHSHRICGQDNSSACDHLKFDTDKAQHTQVDSDGHLKYGEEEFPTDKKGIVIDVHHPIQLLYAWEHPEYMYVLSNNITIDISGDNIIYYQYYEEDGTPKGNPLPPVNLQGVLNDPDHPVRDFKLCLNGYTIKLKSTDGTSTDPKALFALAGDCYITDCHTEHVAASSDYSAFDYEGTYDDNYIGYFYNKGTWSELKNAISFMTPKSESGANNEMVFKGHSDNFKNSTIFGFGGDKLGDITRFENVKFDSIDTTKTIIDTKGPTYLDNLYVTGCTFDNSDGKSFIRMSDNVNGDKLSGDNYYAISNGRDYFADNNKVINGSALVDVDLVANNFEMNRQEGVTGYTKISDNTVKEDGFIHIGHDESSDVKITMEKFEFTENKGGPALFLDHVSGDEGSAVFTDNKFIKNGYDSGSGYSSNNVKGGAVHIEGSKTDGELNTHDFNFENCIFQKNVAGYGGAFYIKGARNISITGKGINEAADNATFYRNYATEGSSIYYEAASSDVGAGGLNLENLVIRNDGGNYGANIDAGSAPSSKGNSCIYIDVNRSEGQNKAILLNNIKMDADYAEKGIITFKRANEKTPLNIGSDEGTDDNSIENCDGSAFYFDLENDSGIPKINFEGGNTKKINIINNKTNRFVVDKNDAAAKSSVSFALNTNVQIRDNLNSTTNRLANMRIWEGMEFDVNHTLSPDSRIYINMGDVDQEKEIPIFKWNEAVTDDANYSCWDTLIADNSNKVDEAKRSQSNFYAAYKGNDTQLYIGNRSFAKPIYKAISKECMEYIKADGESTEKTNRIIFWAKKDSTVTIEPLEEPTVIPTDCEQGHNWISRNENGDYKEWVFSKIGVTADKYYVSTDSTIDHIDYVWKKEHKHQYDEHTRDIESWILAYDESFLHSTYVSGPSGAQVTHKNGNVILDCDIKLTQAIKDTETGFAVCLNGYTLTQAEDDNLLKLTDGGTAAERFGAIFVNCEYEADGTPKGKIINDATNGSSKPMFELFGTSISKLLDNKPTVELYGVNLQNKNYIGTGDGVFIAATYSNLFIGKFAATAANDYKYTYISGDENKYNSKTPFYLNNTGLKLEYTHIRGSGDNEIGDNGFFYMKGSQQDNDDKYHNAIRSAMDHVSIDDLIIVSKKAFFNFENTMTEEGTGAITVKTFNVGYSNNKYEGALGSLFYLKDTSDFTIDQNGADPSDYNVMTRFENGGYGGLVYVDNFTSVVNENNGYRKITIKDLDFKDEKSISGGAIYYNKSEGHNVKANVELILDGGKYHNSLATEAGSVVYLGASEYTEYKNKFTIQGDIEIVSNGYDPSGWDPDPKTQMGGAFYISDTIMNTNFNTVVDITDNKAYSGGALYQKRSVTKLSNVNFKQNVSVGEGAVIYIDGSDAPNVNISDINKQKHDRIQLGEDGKEFLINGNGNYSISSDPLVTIGTYSDLIFDGTVVICDDDNKNHTDGKHSLYIKGAGLKAEDLTGVKRAISDTFKESSGDTSTGISSKNYSYIVAYTERIDFVIANNWVKTAHADHDHAEWSFIPYAATLDSKPNTCYTSGTEEIRNVHIGNGSAPINFITFDGIKFVSFHAKKDSSKGAPNVLGENMSTLISEAQAKRPGDTLLGFVANVSDADGSNSRWEKYDENKYVYIDPNMDELNIIAVWKDSNVDFKTYNDANEEMTVNLPTINVECYEQLYYADSSTQYGYKLNNNIQDKYIKYNDAATGIEYWETSIDKPIVNTKEYIYTNNRTIKLNYNNTFYKQPAMTSDDDGLIINADNTNSLFDITNENQTADVIAANKVVIRGKGKITSHNAYTQDFAFIRMENEDAGKFEDGTPGLYITGDDETNRINFENNGYKLVLSHAIPSYIRNVAFNNNIYKDALIEIPDTELIHTANAYDSNGEQYPHFDNVVFNNSKTDSISDDASLIKVGGNANTEIANAVILHMNNCSYEPGSNNGAFNNMIVAGTASNTEDIIKITNSKFIQGSATAVNKHLFTLHGNRLMVENTVIKNHKVSGNLIEQKGANGKIGGYTFKNCVIENNTANDGNSSIIYQDAADTTSGTFEHNALSTVSITANIASGSVYNAGELIHYYLGGEVIIKNNVDASGNPSNLILKDSNGQGERTVDFINSDYENYDNDYLASTSEIHVGFDTEFTSDTQVKYIAYDSWTTEKKISGSGVIFDVFKPDDSDYIIVKDGTSITMTKETNYAYYVVQGFETYGDVENPNDIRTQYLAFTNNNHTIADEPRDPISVKGWEFGKWMLDKNYTNEYEFSDGGNAAEADESTPRRATIYCAWNRRIAVTVHTNTLDSGAYKPVHIDSYPEEIIVATYNVMMGKKLSECDEITDGYRTYPNGTKLNFVREGLSAEEDWYPINGFNGGEQWPQASWGNAWKFDENIVTTETDLYLRWVGERYDMTYEYCDSGSSIEYATGSTAVENRPASDVTDVHYNDYFGAVLDYKPLRHGYDFVDWHVGSPSGPVARSTTKNSWANNITVYAEWKIKNYPVVYSAKEGEYDNWRYSGQGKTGLATVSGTRPFDEGYRDQSLLVDDVYENAINGNPPFARNGYRFGKFNYTINKVTSGIQEAVADDPLGTTNFYNSRIVENAGVYSVDDGEPTVLEIGWEPNTYRLIYDLNDGSVYSATHSTANADGYKGSNYADDISDSANIDSENHYFYNDVTFDNAVGYDNELPEPTRRGYTFDGWYKYKNSVDQTPDAKVESNTPFSWEEITHELDTSGKATDVPKIATDTRIYAKWKKNKYTIKFRNTDNDSMTVPTGTIDNKEVEFDTATPFTIKAMKNGNNGEPFYKVDGYRYDGFKIYYNGEEVASKTVDNAIEDIIYNDVTIDIDADKSKINLGFDEIEENAEIELVGRWTEHTYKIEYHAEFPAGAPSTSGDPISTSSAVKYETEEIDILMEGLTADGYKFMGWATNSTTKEIVYSSEDSHTASKLASKEEDFLGDMVSHDGEIYKLYAVWKKNPYTINFLPGNDAEYDESFEYNHPMIATIFETNKDTDQALPMNTYRILGFTFDHWKDNGYIAPGYPTGVGYKATYSNGDIVPGGVEAKNIRIGSSEDMVEVDLTAEWREHSYKITWDYNPPISSSGEANIVSGTKADIVAKYTEVINLGAPEVTIPGYVFSRWEFDGNSYEEGESVERLTATLSEYADATTHKLHEAKIKYIWEPNSELAIALNYNNADKNNNWTSDEDEFAVTYDRPYNSMGNNLPTLTRAGYTFDAYTKVPATPYEIVGDSTYKITTNSDIVRKATPNNFGFVETLYAHWKHNTYELKAKAGEIDAGEGAKGITQAGYYDDNPTILEKSYDVRYDRPIGKTPNGDYAESDRLIATPTLPGYTFDHWENDNEEIVTEDTALWEPDNNRYITAKWKANTFKINFLPGNPTATDVVEGTMATLSVTFDDTDVNFVQLDENDSATTFKLKGHTFDYWENTNTSETLKNANSEFKASYSNTEDQPINVSEIDGKVVNFIAHWKEHDYSVIFDSNVNGTKQPALNQDKVIGTMENQEFTYRQVQALTPNVYEIPGYEFKGWASVSNATTPDWTDGQLVSRLAGHAYGSTGEDDTITLYAVWEQKPIEVKFNLNDNTRTGWGSTDASATFSEIWTYIVKYDDPYGSAIGATNGGSQTMDIKPTEREGYDFIGWYEPTTDNPANEVKNIARSARPGSMISKTDIFRSTESITLYALWDNKAYNVTLDVDTHEPKSGDPPQIVISPEVITVYFDCAFGSNGEKNGTDGTITDLPHPTQTTMTSRGWFYDDTFWVDPFSKVTNGTPSEATRIFSNTILDKNRLVNIATYSGSWTAPNNIKIHHWFGGTGNKLALDPMGGSIYFGGEGGIEKGRYDSSVASASCYLEVVVENQIDDALNNLPTNKTTDDNKFEYYVKGGDGYGDDKDPVYKKGYIFTGWKTNKNVDPSYNGSYDNDQSYFDGDTVYWEEKDSLAQAQWEVRKYHLKYEANIPDPNSTKEIAKYDANNVEFDREASTRDLVELEGSSQEESTGTYTIEYGATLASTSHPIVKLPGYDFGGWYTRISDGYGGYEEIRLDNQDYVWELTEENAYIVNNDSENSFEFNCEKHVTPTGVTEKEDFNYLKNMKELRVYAKWTNAIYEVTWDGHKTSGYTSGAGGTSTVSITFVNDSARSSVVYTGTATSNVVFDKQIPLKAIPKFARDGYTSWDVFAIEGTWPGSEDWTAIDFHNTNDEPSSNNDWETKVDQTIVYDYNLIGINDTFGEANTGKWTFHARWLPNETTVKFDGNKPATASNFPKVNNKANPTKNPHIYEEKYLLYDDKLGRERKESDGLIWKNRVATGIKNRYPEKDNGETLFDEGNATRILGWKFVSWNTKADGTGETVTSDRIATVSTTYYAQWNPREYSITFNNNDSLEDHGSTQAASVIDSIDVKFDSKVPALSSPSRFGYEFVGWFKKDGYNAGKWNGDWGDEVKEGTDFNFKAETGNNGAFKNMITEEELEALEIEDEDYEFELRAKWKKTPFTIKFDINDYRSSNGTTEGKLKINGGYVAATPYEMTVYIDNTAKIENYETLAERGATKLPLGTNLTRDGYDFERWTHDGSEGGTEFNFDTELTESMLSGNTEYKAFWRAQEWTVTFDTTVRNEYKAPSGAIAVVSGADSIGALNNLTVTFDANPPATPLFNNHEAHLYTNGTEEGYTFDKWNISKDLNQDAFGISDAFKLDKDLLEKLIVAPGQTQTRVNYLAGKTMRLYPKFDAITYDVKFNSNYDAYLPGESPADESNQYHGGQITASFNEIVTLDYPVVSSTSTSGWTGVGGRLEFLGWSLSANSGKDNPVDYPINDSNPTNPIKLTRLLSKPVPAEGITLYGKWVKQRLPIKYENSDGLSWNNITADLPTYWNDEGTENKGYDNKIPGLQADLVTPDTGCPVRAGANFSYWEATYYSNKDFTGTEVTEISTVSFAFPYNNTAYKSAKLVAHWEIIGGQILLDPNGGTGNRVPLLIPYGQSGEIPPVTFARVGYHIDHWSLDANDHPLSKRFSGSVTNDFLPNDAVANVYVYAIWKTDNQNTEQSSSSFRSGGRSSAGGGGGGGGGGAGGGGMAAANLSNLNQYMFNTTLENANQLLLTLGASSSDKVLSNGVWVYDQLYSRWMYSIPINGMQVNVGNLNNGADLQKLATNGMFNIQAANGTVDTYMFDQLGTMLTGYQTQNGKNYYFDPKTGAMVKNNWANVNGQMKFFNQNGEEVIGGDELAKAIIALQQALGLAN